MWEFDSGPHPVDPIRDHDRYYWVLVQGENRHETYVEISRTAALSDPHGLPSPIGDAVVSKGESVLRTFLAWSRPPEIIEITTTNIRPFPGTPEPQ